MGGKGHAVCRLAGSASPPHVWAADGLPLGVGLCHAARALLLSAELPPPPRPQDEPLLHVLLHQNPRAPSSIEGPEAAGLVGSRVAGAQMQVRAGGWRRPNPAATAEPAPGVKSPC